MVRFGIRRGVQNDVDVCNLETGEQLQSHRQASLIIRRQLEKSRIGTRSASVTLRRCFKTLAMQVLEPIGRHALNVRAALNDRRQQTMSSGLGMTAVGHDLTRSGVRAKSV